MTGVYIVIQIGVYVVTLWMPLILSALAHEAGCCECEFDRAICDRAVPDGDDLYFGGGAHLRP